jgi:hypothetical protein
MKVQTSVKAGVRILFNHAQTIAVKTGVKAGALASNHSLTQAGR